MFLDLEIRDERWKEEIMHRDEINQTGASKLLAKIENPWSVVEKWT